MIRVADATMASPCASSRWREDRPAPIDPGRPRRRRPDARLLAGRGAGHRPRCRPPLPGRHRRARAPPHRRAPRPRPELGRRDRPVVPRELQDRVDQLAARAEGPARAGGARRAGSLDVAADLRTAARRTALTVPLAGRCRRPGGARGRWPRRRPRSSRRTGAPTGTSSTARPWSSSPYGSPRQRPSADGTSGAGPAADGASRAATGVDAGSGRRRSARPHAIGEATPCTGPRSSSRRTRHAALPGGRRAGSPRDPCCSRRQEA